MATVGENHPDTAITYSNIGSVYTNKGEYDLALEKYDKSLNIKMATVGENHPDTAVTYKNMATAYYRQNMFYKAYQSMVLSLEVLLKIEKSDLTKIKIKKYFSSLNNFMNKAQRSANKDQKAFMQKKSKEIKTKAKSLKIKL